MARFPLGQPVRIPWNTYAADGTTLTDAGANSLTIKFANADGTSTATAGSPYTSPVHDGTGAYHQDVAATDLTTLGHYQWAATSTGAGAGVKTGDFDVFDPFEPALLPLADGKDHLNIPQTVTAYDAEIGAFIASIETSLEAMTGGPLVSRSITERGEFSCDMLTMTVKQRPLVSVTSIVSIPNGATVDLTAGLDLDPLDGTIRTQGGWAFSAFSRLATVTYVAGWGVRMPAAFNLAARIILAYLWSTQRGPAVRPAIGGTADLVAVTGFPYAIPNGAAQLLNGELNGLPFRLAGGVFA